MPESIARAEKGGRSECEPLRAHASSLPSSLYLLSFAPPYSLKPTHPYNLYAVGTAAALTAGVSLPAFDIVFGRFTNGINALDPAVISASANQTGWIMTVVGVVTAACFAIFTYCFSLAGVRLSNSLREQYLAAIIVQDQAFFDRIGPGEVVTRSSKDIDSIRTGLGERLGYLIWSISTILTALISAFVHVPRLAGVLFAMIPFIMAVFTGLGYWSDHVSRSSDVLDGKAATLIEQMLSSVRIIQSFNLAPRLLSKLEYDMLEPLRRLARKKTAVKGLEFGIAFGAGFLVYSMAFWYGGIEVSRGQSVGHVMTSFYNYVNLFFAFAGVVPHLVATTTALHTIGNLRKQIERKPPIDVRDQSGVHLDPSSDPCFQLERVTFAYPSRPDQKALDDVSITIPSGKFTAFVGPSGSGKSTLASLLLRLYDPATANVLTSEDRQILGVSTEKIAVVGNGKVLFAHHDLRDLNITSLRQNIAVVQQNPQLVSGTVFDNVAIGLTGSDLEYRPDIDGPNSPRYAQIKPLILAALQKAQALEFVSRLPDGLDTIVTAGRTGVLSGGQVQRIAIARALVRQPRCLLLDEATSAVSADTEISIQQALLAEQQERGMTLIVIAHRLSTIVAADQIVVMANGQVVQTGTYDELLDPSCSDPTFRSLALPNATESASSSSSRATTIAPSSQETKLKAPATPPLPPPITSTRHAFANVKLFLFLGVALGLLGGATFVIVAWLQGRAIVALSIPNFVEMRAAANRWALWFLITALAAFAVIAIHGFSLEYSGERIVCELRRESVRALVRQDIAFFEGQDTGSGALTAAASQSPANVGNFVGLILAQIISSSTNLIATLIMAFVLNWRLAVMVLPSLFLTTLLGYINFKCQEKYEERLTAKIARQSEFIAEAANSITVLSALSREAETARQFRSRFGSTDLQWLSSATITMGANQSMIFLFAGLIFWWGGTQVARGNVLRADVFSVIEAVAIAIYTSAKIWTYTGDFTRLNNALKTIHSWISRVPQIDKHPMPIGDIRVRNVSVSSLTPFSNQVELRYPSRPDILALASVSLNLRPGKSYAFCGTSGAGKSSILAVLQRFYDISSGSIVLDGRDIRQWDLDHLRQQMGYVSQEPILYDMSVRWNLISGAIDPDAVTEAELEEACRQACILDFIRSLPQGFDTELGLKGGQLSGGQRQRLCIARALLRNPRILLLDEATSALDGKSEAVVQEALDNASRGRMTITIAHRLSTIRKADVIFVMEHGTIVESGSHQDLLSLQGRYYELVQSQL
ncbi:uncharacterized protein I303_102469 [Kwoniella dejecticola CBS 10117]|uniref:ATP-binding cassette, subfamily B (MDR/TAP), member 1 n=1 Tax=Kwoniella dejecticola CBS 10117 TaxID=1296121 RepID=A0A1A6A8V3_9TREE|nr:uncharacterized protein I303_02484 [Kwoniella dejecticola CBS 10117]OBR86477.1 hypothetical protein I303_02484 [Kwoniella dejecticola CBS 10117]